MKNKIFLTEDQMSMGQNRDAGRNYIENKINSRMMAELSWNEPYNQDISELTVTRGGKKKTYIIDALDLEDPQRHSCLDQIGDLIIKDFC